jgi:hypothetical protein
MTPANIQISTEIDHFIKTVEEEYKKYLRDEDKRYSDDAQETDQIAFWYEKIRIAIDYREEHLLRRTASRRILKRLFIIEGRRKEVADVLLRELIMGGYVKKSDLTEEKFVRIDRALNKYAYVISKTYEKIDLFRKASSIRRWFISIASYEIEEILFPFKERRALINAMYNLISPRINPVGMNVSLRKKNLQTYIAIFKSLSKADRAMVVSEVFHYYFPFWFDTPTKEVIDKIYQDSQRIIDAIKKQTANPLSSKIFYAIKKQTLFAHILYEVAKDNPADVRGIVSQDYLLNEFATTKAEEEYERAKIKLNRRIKRGVIYIFVTKILIALALEIPFERYVLGEIHYLSLAINILFPPIFMVILAKSARMPGEENTKAIIQGIKNLVFDDPRKEEIGRINITTAYSKFSERTLNFIYFIVFSTVFGGVIWLLNYLNFNYVSGTIFIVFMGTVSFFGALIRQTIRDLVVIKEKEGLISLFFDTMLLPFVRFGRWLSTNFSKLNFFMFILDVIIEAPFKMIIQLFESWINFLKKKREEVDQQFDIE